jgi:hypothetical protein
MVACVPLALVCGIIGLAADKTKSVAVIMTIISGGLIMMAIVRNWG